MRYQVMELDFPRLSHGKTDDDDRALEVPGRIIAVITAEDSPGRKQRMSVLVELDGGDR